jgi:hypothetical protein
MNIVVVQYTFQRCQLIHGDHYYRFWKAEYQVKITDKRYPLHIECGGTKLCSRSSLLCEPVSLRVAVNSHNRQDLIHSLVPTHYVCNKFI